MKKNTDTFDPFLAAAFSARIDRCVSNDPALGGNSARVFLDDACRSGWARNWNNAETVEIGELTLMMAGVAVQTRTDSPLTLLRAWQRKASGLINNRANQKR